MLRHKIFRSSILPPGCPSAFLGRDAPGRLELNRTRHYFVFGRCFFQLVTLPVEFNASARAKRIIVSEGFIRNSEEHGVNKVLNAAALTYCIAALVSLFSASFCDDFLKWS
ncbi:zinc metallopeptidase [Bacillus velezensis]|nr:zinc metallopeptidase [Bacillus velezensis]